MRRISPLWILLLASSLYGCGGGDGGAATAVRGYVTDTTGSPLSGVRVTSDLGTTFTDTTGRFEFTGAMSAELVVRFEKAGYVTRVDKSRLVAGQVTARHAILLEESAAQLLDSALGGMIAGPGSSEIMVPADALVDSTGTPVTGMVDVHLTPVDVSDSMQAQSVGGDMLGDMSGNVTLIESFGIMDITIRQDGEELSVASGMAFDVAIPVPSAVTSPGAETGLWSYDEDNAQWKLEGTMTYDADDGVYRASVSHMSPWNADDPVTMSCVCGTVVDGAGTPVAGVLMALEGVDYLGVTTVLSGADGRFCAVVRANSSVRVYPYPEGLSGEDRVVSTGSETTTASIPDESVCTDGGVWSIDPDTYFPPGSDPGGGGASEACDRIANPLAGTCADDLLDLIQCVVITDECQVDFEDGGVSSTLDFVGGGSIVIEVDTMADTFMATYRSPSDDVCGTLSGDTDTDEFMFSVTGGATFTLAFDEDTGDSIITCPGAVEVRLTAVENAALNTCFGSGDSGAICGSGVGLCTDNSDCSGGLICCTLATGNICLDQASCDAFCTASSQCPGTQVCCSFGTGVNICLESGFCDTPLP